MTTEELYDKLKLIQKMKCKTQNLELKSAEQGCPKRLYDSLSSFSNLFLFLFIGNHPDRTKNFGFQRVGGQDRTCFSLFIKYACKRIHNVSGIL